MRIVQTFWTAGQDPLKHSFGWSHPQYNLMSWALSCLSLREHYDDVELYTDSAGYHILIEVLGLPYTKTHVVFDDFKCMPHHWALAKIKTYSMQTEPFIHVDGDVYLPQPLPKAIEAAPLVAQNREIGTQYYRKMLDDGLLCYSDVYIPENIKGEVLEDSVLSFNMGFFGGRDIGFIDLYCREAFNFFDRNKLNDPCSFLSNVNCNVFVEQILFAILTKIHGKPVMTITNESIRDNGYTVKEFCDLFHYDIYRYFHILGGHKKNSIVLDDLYKILLSRYPDKALAILSMFPKRNLRFMKNGLRDLNNDDFSLQKAIAEYEDFVKEASKELSDIDIIEQIEVSAKGSRGLGADGLNRGDDTFVLNPFARFFTLEKWNAKAISILATRIGVDSSMPIAQIAILPSLSDSGIQEIAIMEEDVTIIDNIKNGLCTFNAQIDSQYRQGRAYTTCSGKNHFLSEWRYLIRKEVIIVEN